MVVTRNGCSFVVSFFSLFVILTIVVSFSKSETIQNNFYIPDGLQSGPDLYHNNGGVSFVTSAIYSAKDHTILLTGHTNGRFFESHAQKMDEDYNEQGMKRKHITIIPGCFLATITLPSTNTTISGGDNGYLPNNNNNNNKKIQTTKGNTNRTKLQFVWKQRLHSSGSSQTNKATSEHCTAVHMYGSDPEIVVVGHSKRTSDKSTWKEQKQLSSNGMILDLTYRINQDKSFMFHGGKLLDNSDLHPVGVTSFHQDKISIFVLCVEFTGIFPDVLSVRNHQLYHTQEFKGIGNGIVLARYDVTQMKQKLDTTKINDSVIRMEQIWSVNYFNSTTDDIQKNQETGYVARCMAAIGDHSTSANSTLLIAGNTNDANAFPSDTTKRSTSDDFDGFLYKVNPTTGFFNSSVRIKTDPHGIDWIEGICHSPYHTKYVYITGSTEKKSLELTTVGFVMKLDVETLQTKWIRKIHASGTNAYAVALTCAVTPDGESLWVGGSVGNNGILEDSGLVFSYGQNDIFVARYVTSNGNLEFVHQLGTSENDYIATNGGLVTDMDGNAIVVGNTHGSMYRQRRHSEDHHRTEDVFVVTVSRETGQIKAPFQNGRNDVLLSPLIHNIEGDSSSSKWMILLLLGCGVLFVIKIKKTSDACCSTAANKVKSSNSPDVAILQENVSTSITNNKNRLAVKSRRRIQDNDRV